MCSRCRPTGACPPPPDRSVSTPGRTWQKHSAGLGSRGDRIYSWAWIELLAEDDSDYAQHVRYRLKDSSTFQHPRRPVQRQPDRQPVVEVAAPVELYRDRPVGDRVGRGGHHPQPCGWPRRRGRRRPGGRPAPTGRRTRAPRRAPRRSLRACRHGPCRRSTAPRATRWSRTSRPRP